MDAFDFGDDIETKSQSTSIPPMPRVSRFLYLREIKKMFRIVEIFLISVFLTWVSTWVPFAVRISGEYFRQLINVVITPLFIFLLGNFIVLTLFFKSRHLFPPQHEPEAVFDFIESGPYYFPGDINSSPPPEEVVFQDKQTIFEVRKVFKVHRRTQSENFSRSEKKSAAEGDSSDSSCRKQLRRSETEKRRKTAAENVEIVDDLSNDEFQRAIEAFIAKQIKFHQEEKLAIVLHATN